MTQRFEKSYNALYNAFMNGTLGKGTCTACAIGNIVADAMGVEITRVNNNFKTEKNVTFWANMFFTSDGIQVIMDNWDYHEVDDLFNLTGYTVHELMKIEYAFETNTKICFIAYQEISEQEVMEDQFNGLMAVMDVLIELDKVEDGELYKESFKNKFVTI